MSLDGIQNVSRNTADNILVESAGYKRADIASKSVSDMTLKDTRQKPTTTQQTGQSAHQQSRLSQASQESQAAQTNRARMSQESQAAQTNRTRISQESQAVQTGRAKLVQTNQTNANQEEQTETANQKKYNEIMTGKAVENANNRIKASHTNAKFEFDDKINRVTITITDSSNDEIVREIPPEATQKMLERIHTFSGILMDTEI